jgi:hypothetical protein
MAYLLGNPKRSMPYEHGKVQVDNTIETVICV